MTTEGGEEAIIVEATATKVRPSPVPRPVAQACQLKYEWKLDPSLGPMYAVPPRVAFALIDRPEELTGTATRWLFDGEPILAGAAPQK